MNIPSVLGQYATLNLNAKQNAEWALGFDVVDSFGNAVNMAVYNTIIFTVTDSQNNEVLNVTPSVVNVSSLLVEANVAQMNIPLGYYGYDLTADAEVILTGTMRLDKRYV
jgi:hypothetical protein